MLKIVNNQKIMLKVTEDQTVHDSVDGLFTTDNHPQRQLLLASDGGLEGLAHSHVHTVARRHTLTRAARCVGTVQRV